MPAAAKALRMKSYSSMAGMNSRPSVRISDRLFVPVSIALHVLVARHDKNPSVHPDHLDLVAIETRQHRAGDHLLDRPKRRLPTPEIEHAIKRPEQRVQLMRAEDHGDAKLHLQRFHQFHHAALMPQ